MCSTCRSEVLIVSGLATKGRPHHRAASPQGARGRGSPCFGSHGAVFGGAGAAARAGPQQVWVTREALTRLPLAGHNTFSERFLPPALCLQKRAQAGGRQGWARLAGSHSNDGAGHRAGGRRRQRSWFADLYGSAMRLAFWACTLDCTGEAGGNCGRQLRRSEPRRVEPRRRAAHASYTRDPPLCSSTLR